MYIKNLTRQAVIDWTTWFSDDISMWIQYSSVYSFILVSSWTLRHFHALVRANLVITGHQQDRRTKPRSKKYVHSTPPRKLELVTHFIGNAIFHLSLDLLTKFWKKLLSLKSGCFSRDLAKIWRQGSCLRVHNH